jgi:flagellar motor switch protein FliN
MANNSGLSQDEIDALLEGSGLDDFDSSYIPDEEEDIFSVESGPTEAQITAKPKKSKPVYSEIDEISPEELLELPNLEIINDIKVSLSVEIGRTKMNIKEILDLGEGSIVELNKYVDEPVDVLVNDMIIAKGIIVTIGDNFGVKITSIINEEERYKFILQ